MPKPAPAKTLFRFPVNWQKRIVAKIKGIAVDPYARHNNVTRLQGRDGYRLRIGDWRVIYELHDDRLELWVRSGSEREEYIDADRDDYPQGQGIRRDSGEGPAEGDERCGNACRREGLRCCQSAS